MKNMEENKYKNPIMEHYEVDGQMNLSECMQAMQIQRKLTILKGALILREILGVRVNSKEETTRMAQNYTDAELSFWISFLREESHKAADIREKEAEERIQWEAAPPTAAVFTTTNTVTKSITTVYVSSRTGRYTTVISMHRITSWHGSSSGSMRSWMAARNSLRCRCVHWIPF